MKLVFALFLSALIFSTNGVHGRKALSVEEDLELENKLKLLNKPAIKTIRTEHGDIFDCVDIYKQPALDHPLLKNHKIQVKPGFSTEVENQRAWEESEQMEIGLKDGECPQGTVPIKRVRKEDLISGKPVLKRYSGVHDNTQLSNSHFAITRASGNYHGAVGDMVTYTPEVVDGQASQSTIWISSGNPEDVNSIHAGWTVDPQLYNDNRTRLYTYWTGDGYRKTGCYNIQCPGFVQVSPRIAMGLALRGSTYKGTQLAYKVMLLQDSDTQNWWLLLGDDQAAVGYWPKALFTTLAKSAKAIDWGGAAYHSADQPMSPPMGSGYFPQEGRGVAAFFAQIKVYRKGNSKFEDPDESALQRFCDKTDLYGVSGKVSKLYIQPGYGFFYGGPGGKE